MSRLIATVIHRPELAPPEKRSALTGQASGLRPQASAFSFQLSGFSLPLLGDLVERLAAPIARLIDRLTARTPWPTYIAGCSACSRRRRWLNQADTVIRAWLFSVIGN